MARSAIFLLPAFALFMLCAPAYASFSIPSVGTKTNQEIREELRNPHDFLLNFDKATQTEGDGFLAQAANIANFPVFGGQDVQSATNRIFLHSHAAFPTHSHPRATETLFLQQGKLVTQLRQEGLLDGEAVKLIVKEGEVTVFPQGLAHSIKCVSSCDCVYITYFNSADPGVSAAPDFKRKY